MSSQQLWLIPEPKPLRERFGDGFFKSVPTEPGVYVMRDARDRVIYVGQSKNLRHRLSTYKNVRPEKDARKLVRLAQAVVKISWETCASPERARLRENELLRQYRPRFNRVNTRPEAYGFIGVRATPAALELWLAQDASSRSDGGLYGAFKGLRWTGYAAMLRLLVRVVAGRRMTDAFPAGLLGRMPPRRYGFYFRSKPEIEQGTTATDPDPEVESALESGQLPGILQRYLEGVSPEFVDWCEARLPSPADLPLFYQALQAFDLESAREFFERGPKRNRLLQERHGLGPGLIAPAALDDLVAITRLEPSSSSE